MKKIILIAALTYFSLLNFPSQAKENPSEKLDLSQENYSIRLVGSFSESNSFDLEMISAGSDCFATFGDFGNELHCSITSRKDNKVSILYKLNGDIPIKTTGINGSATSMYKRVTFSSAIVLTLGEPLKIISLNKNDITLTVSKLKTEEGSKSP